MQFGPLLVCAVLALTAAPEARAQVYVFEDESGRLHFSDVRHHAGYQPLPRKEPAPEPKLAKRGRSGRSAWDGLIRRGARSNGLSASLVKAVVHVESLFNPRAVSHKGAQGLMQLMPGTAAELGVDDPFDPWQNISGGTRYLGTLMRRFDGDLKLALAAYHAGPNAVRRHGGIPPYPTTRSYVKKVLRYYRQYDADFR